MGPPTTNRPVGLMSTRGGCGQRWAGSTGWMIRSATSRRRVSMSTPASCWVESTTVSTASGRSPRYRTVTWLLASGRSQGNSPFRRSCAWRSTSRWASRIGKGISSGVSSQAQPNISPWSPAPISSPRSTPWRMSADWWLNRSRISQRSGSMPGKSPL